VFVTLGLGSVVSSAVSALPVLAVISRQKNVAFALAGAMLAVNYWMVVVRPRQCLPGEVCHVDSPLMAWNRRLFWLSVVIYVAALAITYGTPLFI
jgi:cell division FtsZ-interacting protein ZapD